MFRVVAALSACLAMLCVAWPKQALACAGCSNPNLPSGRGEARVLGPKEISATFNLTGTTMHVVHSQYCPDIGPICQMRDEPGQLHDQRIFALEFRPIVAVGITKWLSAELQLPFRMTNTSISFRRLDGTLFTPDYESIHHRNETLGGIGDPWLLARGGWALSGWTFTAKTGVAIPLGSTVVDPFELGDAGKSHQHIQFGTGTFNPLLGLDVTTKLGRFLLGAYGQAQWTFYENKHGYRAGNRYMGGLSGETTFFEKLRVGIGADILNEQPERWGGAIKQDGNVGRTDVLAGGMVGYNFGSLAALLSVKVPVWQKFQGTAHDGSDPGQLTYPAIVNIAVQTDFGTSKR